MPRIKLDDITLVYPFIEVTGLFNRKEKKKILDKQMSMPYTSNEGVVAVQHFSCDIKDGEFVVIVGPSGSGKTSVLRMIAGLERPSLGKIYFDDKEMNMVKPEDRDVAMVFQNYSIYPNQTVYENISFPLKNQHLPRDVVDKKVKEIISLLKLDNKEDRLPEDLSGGERQRVAIARALVRKPKLFLLDEPFSNLDEMMKNSLRLELKRIQKELGITFIYVTHDQKDALILADRIIVMKDGIINQDDSSENVYNYPNNLFCGQFVGYPAMNIFDNIEINDGYIDFYSKKIKLNSTQLKLINNEKELIVGFRPFNIAISKKGVKANVEYCEIDGNDLVVHTLVDNKEVLVVERNMNQQGLKYLNGQEIYLDFDYNYIYLFKRDGCGLNVKEN